MTKVMLTLPESQYWWQKQAVHQAPVVSVLVWPKQARLSFLATDRPIKIQTLIREDRDCLTGVLVFLQTQLSVCSSVKKTMNAAEYG